MSDHSLSAGQAFGRWVLLVFVFVVAGGIAAGLSSIAYEMVSQAQNPVAVYGIVFAAGGYIAYRLAERVLDG